MTSLTQNVRLPTPLAEIAGILSRRELALALAACAFADGAIADRPPDRPWTLLVGDLDVAVLAPIQVKGDVKIALVDTGALRTVIDRKLASRWGLGASNAIGVESDAGAATLDTSGPLQIGVGEHRVNLERVIVADLTLLAQTTAGAPQIILGQDVIGSSPVEFDFPNRRMRFIAAIDEFTGEGVHELKMSRDRLGRFGAPIVLEAAPPVLAVFDLGSSNPLMLSETYARAAGLLNRRPLSTAAIGTLTGTEVGRAFMIHDLSVGGARLQGVPGLALGNWIENDFPANIGLPVLRRFRIAMSIAENRLRLSPDQAAISSPFQRDRSGLGLSFEGDHLRVRHVASGSPAEAGGWREGEDIRAVNGALITNDPARALAPWRFQRAGVSVRLTLSTGEIRTLRLRDYY